MDAKKKKILVEAARIMGSIKTEKKARTSRENGKKGGRPKKEGVDVQNNQCEVLDRPVHKESETGS